MRYKKLVDTIYDRLKDYSDDNSIEYLSIASELCELIQETIDKVESDSAYTYEKLRRERKRAGVIPYGWKLRHVSGTELEEHPTEQKNLHIITYCRDKGYSYARIAGYLNYYGKRNRKRKKFTGAGIHSLYTHLKTGQIVGEYYEELALQYIDEYKAALEERIKREKANTIQTIVDRYGENGVG
jgi:DNA-binding transcriptional MerR regulator